VSLILEALKKLEREKKTPERGFLVTTAPAWPSRSESGLRRVHVAAGLAVAATVALGAWFVLGVTRPRRAAQAPPPAAAPVRPPSPAASVFAPRLATSPRPLPVPPSSAPPAAAAPPVTLPPRALDTKPAAAPAATLASEAPEDAPPPAPAKDAELRLQAVSRRDGKPVAVLNGRLVHEGDAFDDVRVLRIGETEVEIEVGGQRRVLGF